MDGDTVARLKSGDEKTPAYLMIQEDLRNILNSDNDIRSIAVMRMNDGRLESVVDLDYNSLTAHAPGASIGQPYNNATVAMYRGFSVPSAEPGLTTGERGTVLSSYSPVYNSRGNVVGIVSVGISGDIITARLHNLWLQYLLVLLIMSALAISMGVYITNFQNKAFTAVRESEEYLITVLQSLQTGVLVIDARTHEIVDANALALSLIGAPKEIVVGKNCQNYICPEEPGTCPVSDGNRTVENAERTLITAKGERIPVLKSATSIKFGRKLLLLETFTDIRERKKMEELTAQLIRDRELANDELKDFVYIISHDLKAPLRAIGSLSQWLYSDYKDKFDKEGKIQLDLLVNRVNRLQSLIDGILEYSRVGRIRDEKETFDPTVLIREVIDSLSPPSQIRVEIDTPLPAVHYEKTRMRQVFSNLIGNAIKYMDKPQGEIHIGCVQDGDYWKFFVKDNGPGIDEKYYDLVFQIFQTLNARDDIESTGIGLSIVKKIVETYGGKIWIESDVGKGSTFYFTIPLKGKTPVGGTNK
jgi:PAS domain S-box-containing protein